MEAKFVAWECGCLGILFAAGSPVEHIVLVDQDGDLSLSTSSLSHKEGEKPYRAMSAGELNSILEQLVKVGRAGALAEGIACRLKTLLEEA